VIVKGLHDSSSNAFHVFNQPFPAGPVDRAWLSQSFKLGQEFLQTGLQSRDITEANLTYSTLSEATESGSYELFADVRGCFRFRLCGLEDESLGFV